MSKHQIIYTSCMRGIEGVNDGQQVFSYDESFKDSKSDDVKSLFTYQVPALPAGTVMDEEIATTMPASFMYRCLKSGSVAVTLNTYLGRDYMGSAGRFGNHLSHSIVCDFDDFDVYPCELFGGSSLRSSMDYEEVNNPEPPAYLPTPELSKGYAVDPDSVVEFLGIGDNLEYYKKMVTALLSFPDQKRRIIICDSVDNTIMWIAALHYTLPLEIAKKVNFTTYEYDPELSSSQICGVVSEGSRYEVDSYISSNRHYVFDFQKERFSPIDQKNSFLDFLDIAMSFSFDSLIDFQNFVMTKTTYRECGGGYIAAYYLYSCLFDGIADIHEDEFKPMIEFASQYLTDDTRNEFIQKLISEQENIKVLDNKYALLILGYMLGCSANMSNDQLTELKQMIVDRLIVSLSEDGIDEESYIPLYDSIDKMAREVNLSIPAELMVDSNRDTLLGLLEQRVELWKVLFIVRIISDYVIDMHMPVTELQIDQSMGKIYSGIIKLIYTSRSESGTVVIDRIITGFKNFPEYCTYIAVNLETTLKSIMANDSEISYLWNSYYRTIMTMDNSLSAVANRSLLYLNRYEQLYQLYSRNIRNIEALPEVRDYFNNYWDNWFVKNREYGNAYAPVALKEYAAIFESKKDSVPEKDRLEYAEDILATAMKMNITEEYVITLCAMVCDNIPLKKMNSDNLSIVNGMYKYHTEVMHKPLEGKLLLLWIALQFERVTNRNAVITTANSIKAVESSVGARLDGLSDGKIEDYLDWAFGSVSIFCLMSDDYTAIYNLFSFDKHTHVVFMEYWCKKSFKKSKGDKDYSDFAEYLRFVFSMGNRSDIDAVGKYLCKLNKQKLEDLDYEMKQYFKRDMKSYHAWDSVREVASDTNPLLNGLTGLFKKKD